MVVFILGLFALIVLRGFITKMPKSRVIEHRAPEEIPQHVEEAEQEVDAPKIELNKKEIRSQKDQNINELNEAVMAAPEEAAKLLVSFIKE